MNRSLSFLLVHVLWHSRRSERSRDAPSGYHTLLGRLFWLALLSLAPVNKYESDEVNTWSQLSMFRYETHGSLLLFFNLIWYLHLRIVGIGIAYTYAFTYL